MSELRDKALKTKNYIVEEGNNPNGKYRKWNDGTLEMWFDSNLTCAIDAKAGNIYQSIEFPVKYPVASKTSCRPVLSIGGGGAIWGNVYGSSDNFKSGFKYHVLAATSWGKPALLYPIMCVEHGSDKRYLISHSASIKR